MKYEMKSSESFVASTFQKNPPQSLTLSRFIRFHRNIWFLRLAEVHGCDLTCFCSQRHAGGPHKKEKAHNLEETLQERVWSWWCWSRCLSVCYLFVFAPLRLLSDILHVNHIKMPVQKWNEELGHRRIRKASSTQIHEVWVYFDSIKGPYGLFMTSDPKSNALLLHNAWLLKSESKCSSV